MRLLVVDTAQIQPYVFGSNRLRENIGASHLVAQATREWALTAVRSATSAHNLLPRGAIDPARWIESGGVDAEVLYSGGGNFVVLFRDQAPAETFTRTLLRRAATNAPGLQLVIASQPFEWREESANQGQTLGEALQAALGRLAKLKQARTLSSPLLGLGVTKVCRATGLPAVAMMKGIGGDPDYPASSETVGKVRVATAASGCPSEADGRLRRYFPPSDGYAYPAEFDDLGRDAGEYSHIAVVHADGDGIGARFQEIACGSREDDRAMITALRNLSSQVEAAGQTALRATLGKLDARLEGTGQIVHCNSEGEEISRIVLRVDAAGQWLLPFRPIVFGGDDVTFVCDGRLGLPLALEYVRQFEHSTAQLPGGKATACAGVAIVKTHYPFARAYELAESLCRSAKQYRRHRELDSSCIDWHFAPSGLSGSIEEIREREYTVGQSSLTLRPVAMTGNGADPGREWGVVEEGIRAFQGDEWAGRRNKHKALREALRGGSDAVRWFLARFNQGKPLPNLSSAWSDWPHTGWQGGRCGYFDALELSDWFIPLD